MQVYEEITFLHFQNFSFRQVSLDKYNQILDKDNQSQNKYNQSHDKDNQISDKT